MKKVILAAATKAITKAIAIAIAIAILPSCTKHDLNDDAPSQEGFNVSILGEMGEFAATKSTAESCIRLKWENDDVVYAYGSDGSSIIALGQLTVSVEPDNAYVALMTGNLTAAPGDGKLYLVHCPLLTAAPEVSGGAISISLASQPSTCIPFVAYSAVTGVSAAAQDNLKARFSFASSVIKANVYGIAGSTTMLSATLSDVNTACKITFGETLTVAGEAAGVLTKTLGASSSATGKADFLIAVPAIAASDSRTLTVKTGAASWYAKTGAVTKAHAENAYVNTICDMTALTGNAYVDENECYRGEGTAMTAGSTVWAPVNCGYDETHIRGLLYQWGRKYGQPYDAWTMTPVTLTKEQGEDPANSGKFGKFDLSTDNWFSGDVDNTLWNGSSKGTYDPCPSGWRVPTIDELTALIANNSSWTTYTVAGVSQAGYLFGTSPDLVFLPAEGYRYCYNGAACYRGDFGYYWSSSVYDKYARSLSFSDGGAYTGNGLRAGGYTVRCVQE